MKKRLTAVFLAACMIVPFIFRTASADEGSEFTMWMELYEAPSDGGALGDPLDPMSIPYNGGNEEYIELVIRYSGLSAMKSSGIQCMSASFSYDASCYEAIGFEEYAEGSSAAKWGALAQGTMSSRASEALKNGYTSSASVRKSEEDDRETIYFQYIAGEKREGGLIQADDEGCLGAFTLRLRKAFPQNTDGESQSVIAWEGYAFGLYDNGLIPAATAYHASDLNALPAGQFKAPSDLPTATAGAAEGYSITGVVMSYNAKNPVTYELYKMGNDGKYATSPTYSGTAVEANAALPSGSQAQDFMIKGITNGTYEMRMPGLFHITAVSKHLAVGNQKARAEVTIIINEMEGPDRVAIADKNDLTDATWTFTDLGSPHTFTVEFPDSPGYFTNMAVNWKLLDKDHNPVDSTDANVKARISNIVAPSGTKETMKGGTVTVSPVHTTHQDDYYILRVESAIDPSKFDEVKIKVHLNASVLQFTQAQLIMPVDTTINLTSMLQIGPAGDYYATDLEWSYTSTDPSKNYLLYAGGSTVSAGSEPTPASIVETITVTDKISTLSASINIKVITLNSPIEPDQVSVGNLIGPDKDWIQVEGLLENDTIIFYKEYGVKDTPTMEFKNIEASQTPKFKFPVRNFLKSTSGTIGMQVKRDPNGGTENQTTFDIVPVNYDCEPSKVYGYVKLAGKADDSAQNAGIAVQLSGLSNPGVIYTNDKGYFEFDKYIIPGTYTMTISKDNYLLRVIAPNDKTGETGLVIPQAEEFAISTEDDPILLYPGDVTGDGAISSMDIIIYVNHWLGQTNTALTDFDVFDFYESTRKAIDLNDLDLVIRRNGWISDSYPTWVTPSTK